ncbi:MAG: flagellar brake protein [Aeromicrobium sp.]|nr:flagellar brake protein [Burkholderiales bacterium]
MLLRQGFVIESMSQIERLIEIGLFRPATEGTMTGAHHATPYPSKDADAANAPPANLSDTGTPGVTIANAKFEVGMAIQMSSDGYPDERNVVKLVGFLDKHSMLVTHPLKDGAVAFIKEGKEFHCRAFRKRNAYSFSTVVLKSPLAPFPYLHLSYPANVTAVPVRKGSRIPVEIIATIGLKGRTTKVPCLRRDLSLSGVLIQSTEQLGEKGAVVSMAFRLAVDEAHTLFELDLLVRNNMTVENDKNKGIHRTGCEFGQINADLRRLLEL